MPELLLPRSNPVFFQFFSHKVAPLFVPYALLLIGVSNMFLLRGPHLLSFTLQAAWYGAATLGWIASLKRKRKTGMASRHRTSVMKQLALIPYGFVLVNWAAVAGLFHAIRDFYNSWPRSGDGGMEIPIEKVRRPGA